MKLTRRKSKLILSRVDEKGVLYAYEFEQADWQRDLKLTARTGANVPASMRRDIERAAALLTKRAGKRVPMSDVLRRCLAKGLRKM